MSSTEFFSQGCKTIAKESPESSFDLGVLSILETKPMKIYALLAISFGLGFAPSEGPIDSLVKVASSQHYAVVKPDAEWQKLLPENTYLVLRKSATEKPYSGKFWDFHEQGTYVCAGCGQELFSSANKFDSHTGWPSFYKEIQRGQTLTRIDMSEGDARSEIICAHCGGHLGHVFDDGPEPTHLRYCMNSPALKFIPTKAKK